MKDKKPTNICCVCGKKFKGWGNDPWPFEITKEADKSEPVCCDKCNMDYVVPARLNSLINFYKTRKEN